jgi:hypothetical protein
MLKEEECWICLCTFGETTLKNDYDIDEKECSHKYRKQNAFFDAIRFTKTYEEIQYENEIENKGEIELLECGHSLHQNCYKKFIELRKMSFRCPICRCS